jgi:hypothetical protein
MTSSAMAKSPVPVRHVDGQPVLRTQVARRGDATGEKMKTGLAKRLRPS